MMTKFNIDKFGVEEIIIKKWITKLPIINLQYMLALIHSTKYLEKEKKKKSFVLSRTTNAHIHRMIQSVSTHKNRIFNLLSENKHSHRFHVNQFLPT